MVTDRYIVTLWTLDSDGFKQLTRFCKYGRKGLIEAVECVDWDVSKGYAIRGQIERILPNGGMALIYVREGLTPKEQAHEDALATNIREQ